MTRSRAAPYVVLLLAVLGGCAAPTPPEATAPRWADHEGCRLAYPDGSPVPCEESAVAAHEGPLAPTAMCNAPQSGPGWRYTVLADDPAQRFAIHSDLSPGMQLVAAVGNGPRLSLLHHGPGQWESWFTADGSKPIALQVILFNETITLQAQDQAMPVEPKWSVYDGGLWVAYVSPGDPIHAFHQWANLTLLETQRHVSWGGFNLTGEDFRLNVERRVLWMEGGFLAPVPKTAAHLTVPCASSRPGLGLNGAASKA